MSWASRGEKKNSTQRTGQFSALGFSILHFEQPQGPWEDASGKTRFHALKRRRAPGSPAEGAAVSERHASRCIPAWEAASPRLLPLLGARSGRRTGAGAGGGNAAAVVPKRGPLLPQLPPRALSRNRPEHAAPAGAPKEAGAEPSTERSGPCHQPGLRSYLRHGDCRLRARQPPQWTRGRGEPGVEEGVSV